MCHRLLFHLFGFSFVISLLPSFSLLLNKQEDYMGDDIVGNTNMLVNWASIIVRGKAAVALL
jgi:hypothetical protein